MKDAIEFGILGVRSHAPPPNDGNEQRSKDAPLDAGFSEVVQRISKTANTGTGPIVSLGDKEINDVSDAETMSDQSSGQSVIFESDSLSGEVADTIDPKTFGVGDNSPGNMPIDGSQPAAALSVNTAEVMSKTQEFAVPDKSEGSPQSGPDGFSGEQGKAGVEPTNAPPVHGKDVPGQLVRTETSPAVQANGPDIPSVDGRDIERHSKSDEANMPVGVQIAPGGEAAAKTGETLENLNTKTALELRPIDTGSRLASRGLAAAVHAQSQNLHNLATNTATVGASLVGGTMMGTQADPERAAAQDRGFQISEAASLAERLSSPQFSKAVRHRAEAKQGSESPGLPLKAEASLVSRFSAAPIVEVKGPDAPTIPSAISANPAASIASIPAFYSPISHDGIQVAEDSLKVVQIHPSAPHSVGFQIARGPSFASAGSLERPVSVQIAQASPQPGQPSVEITLSPEELGRVRMALSHSDGGLTVTLTVERPETMELMRRHAGELAEQYIALGYESVDLHFQRHSQQSDPSDQKNAGTSSAPSVLSDIDEMQNYTLTLPHTGVDIRI